MDTVAWSFPFSCSMQPSGHVDCMQHNQELLHTQAEPQELSVLPVTTTSQVSLDLLELIAAARDFDDLSRTIAPYTEVLDQQHAAQLAAKLAQLFSRSDPSCLQSSQVQQLCQVAVSLTSRHVEELGPEDAALIMHSLALLQHADKRLWVRLLQQLPMHSQQHPHHDPHHDTSPSPKALALAIYACSLTSNAPNSRWMQQHSATAASTLHAANAQDLSMLLWSYARLGHRPRSRTFWEPFWQASSSQLSSSKPEELVMQLYALAQLKQQPDKQWIRQVTALLQPMLQQLDSQQLAMATWALGSMRSTLSKGWMQQLHEVLQASLPQMTAQGLVMVLWAMSRWQGVVQPSPAWQQQALAELQAKAGQLTAAEGSTALLALARLRWQLPQGLLPALVQALEPQLQRCTPEQLVNGIWALGKLQHQPSQRWLQQHTQAAQQAYQSMDVQQLSMLLWALAKLQHTPELHALADLLAEIESRPLGTLSPQAVVSIMWAVAQLRVKPNKEWLEHMLAMSAKILPNCRWDDQDLVGLVEALAQLGYRPGAVWLDQYALKVDSCMARIRKDRLQAIMRALRQLGYGSSGAMVSWLVVEEQR